MVRPGIAEDSRGAYVCVSNGAGTQGGEATEMALAKTRTCWQGETAHLASYQYGDLLPCTAEEAELT